MAVLKFQQARETVIEQVRSGLRSLERETVPFPESPGRVLAEPVSADRDFPPFSRATRDGYAVRSADLDQGKTRLRCQGQVKAGSAFAGRVAPGECVEIMTGAPVPEGADAVVMVEYTREENEWVEMHRTVAAGDNVVPRGSEARQGDPLLPVGRRIGYGEIAMIASVGRQSVTVYRQPRVAILPTGDEVVELGEAPGPRSATATAVRSRPRWPRPIVFPSR